MKRLYVLLAGTFLLAASLSAQNVIISEFMSSNDSTLADEDGEFSDWIELYNATTNSVDLNGWYLSDARSNPTKWRFPATNMAPNSFLIVFASNKDRKVTGRPLHTNFKLDPNPGEYLGLIRPDLSIATEFNPRYPVQATDISYGFSTTESTRSFVSNGSPAKLMVPLNDNLGQNWISTAFDDSAWMAVTNGVGFERDAASAATPTLIADSMAEFSGTQGSGNWYYGYWDKKADADGVYDPTNDFVQFPRGTGTTLNATNYFDGVKWDWPAPSNPPWIELTSTGGQGSGQNGNPTLAIHWAIRRYVSENAGPLRITGTLACSSSNNVCGDGTVGHILVDGVEVYRRAVYGTSIGYSVVVNANVGSLIDFVIDPGPANNDQCDATTFTASIRTAGDYAIVADSLADWSETGQQGNKSWTYGYWIKTNGTATYTAPQFKAFPSGSGPQSAGNFWDGSQWNWFAGDPPYDTVGQMLMRPSVSPSGNTNALEHWVIRRWVSEISGNVTIDWHFSKLDLTGEGTVARVFLNGAQKDSVTITAADFVGTNRTIAPFVVQVGDTIDFTVEPGSSTPANWSIGDICSLNATIHGSSTLAGQFRTDIGGVMSNITATAYLRIPFNVSDVASLKTLTLRMKSDDGFLAYLNGTLVASRNAPDVLAWDSAATAARLDADAVQVEVIDLTRLVQTVLRNGANVLAIHGLNKSASDADFLIAADLQAGAFTIDTNRPVYFTGPTPGAVNGFGAANLGPIISRADHTPHDPLDTEDILVTAQVTPSLYPIASNGVKLYYRVMFGSESNVVMFDDGLHGDGPAGDGVYGAIIPNTISTFGQMVRYYITATDTNANLMRQPPFPNPQFSAQYFGAVIQNPALTNPLTVLHLFITEANLTGANGDGNGRYLCSLYYAAGGTAPTIGGSGPGAPAQGEFYDNVAINRHGQSSSGFPKKSYDIDFNADHHFLWDPNERRVDDINLLTTFPDKSHMRNFLSYGTYRDAGSPYHYVVPVRVQTNGGFYGDWHIVENGDENFLKRIGRDPNGALYKMYNTFTGIGNTVIGSDPNAEKKTRKFEGNTDLVALFNGINSGTTADRINFMYDNMNVAEIANTMASRILTSDVDCCHKNYYFYRDSDGTGEWEAFPWDVDLAFGRNWQSGETYWDDRVYPNNGLFVGNNNSFFALVFNTATTRQMYLRRVRTLMEEIQQPNGTPASQLNYENQIDQYMAALAPDAALDLPKWGTWGAGTTGVFSASSPYYRSLPDSVSELRTNYMVNRRAFVFVQNMNLSAADLVSWTNVQTNVTIVITNLDYNPISGNQAEEYIQLYNPNRFPVDISRWTLAGAVEHTFQGGAVIPGTNSVYVVADKNAFRNRATPPRRGMGLYIEGPYKGQLSARGETIILSDKTGRIVNTNRYNGNPSAVQNYLRITEIMYHPAKAPTGSGLSEDDFEYIELKNIGPIALNLTGVHFTNGVEFAFAGSAVTTLNPGEYVLVVKNAAAFASRYGSGYRIAGQYVGFLENGGENIRLDDGVGEKILEFTYDNKWYPITDGPGASLVIVNENAPWDTWKFKSSWRPSSYGTGSPGQADPASIAAVPVLVTEVLTHTDPPSVDSIELWNPTTNTANISGWFLSDDFTDPRKYRIPNNTLIPPGGYIVFDETQFNANPGVPPSFSFSSHGDEAYVFSGDGTNLTSYFYGFSFGAAENGVSFGRYVDSQTNEHFVAQSANTLHAANAYPKVGPIVISEIMYHPPDNGYLDNQVDEFVEIHNITGASVSLHDPAFPTNTWHLRGGVDFDFPMNQTMAAGGYALLVSFNPTNVNLAAQFRSKYNVDPGVALYGPYDGKLDNSADSVRLLKPDSPDPGEVPYVLVDEVNYRDDTPWPLSADGIGTSLQRRNVNEFGDDPINWSGGLSPGGTAGGTAPAITSQSGSQAIVAGRTLTLSVAATGTEPLYYVWRFNNKNVTGGTSSTLTIPNIQPAQAGTYRLIVFNSAGSAETTNIEVVVQIPPRFNLHPQNQNIRVGQPVTFTANAVSTTPSIAYQWRFNGANISGATNSSYTIAAVGVSNDGFYDVVATDSIDTVTSQAARLTILIDPIIVQHPALLTLVPSNGTAVLSVQITNTATLPIGYRWRRGGTTVVSNNLNSYFNFLRIENVQGSNNYDVAVYNLSRPGGLISQPQSGAKVIAVADSDGDGIPDYWETQYGFNNGLDDANGDADGDGMSNLAEFIAGTNPRDSLSYLHVDFVTDPRGSTNAVLSFPAVSNKTYTVEFSTDLPNFQKLLDVAAKTNSHIETVVAPAPAGARYYRLATPLQP